MDKELFDKWFMFVVNMWRDHDASDRDAQQENTVRIVREFTGWPEWAILRIGRDMRKLTPEREERLSVLNAEEVARGMD